MPTVRFEPPFPANGRPQTQALDSGHWDRSHNNASSGFFSRKNIDVLLRNMSDRFIDMRNLGPTNTV